MLQITVYGQPAPQGSKKFVGHAKNGRGLMIESSKKVKPWREAVKWAAIEAQGSVAGAVEVEMTFTLPKPASAPKKRQTWPDRKPDLSKLVRSTEDALTDCAVWEDDARVVRCAAAKVFPGEGVDALDRPGAVIRIRPVTAAAQEDRR
jgi:Holliday junction resolvase RusA-like endonuclease